jgi:hypothetical protein
MEVQEHPLRRDHSRTILSLLFFSQYAVSRFYFNSKSARLLAPEMSAERINDKESGLPFHEPSLTPQSSKFYHQHMFRAELTAFIGEFIGTW